MTRCKEAYDKRREVKKIKGQVCSTERSDRVLEQMDAYDAFVETCFENDQDAVYCNFPDRAYHIVAKEPGTIREPVLVWAIQRATH